MRQHAICKIRDIRNVNVHMDYIVVDIIYNLCYNIIAIKLNTGANLVSTGIWKQE